MKVLVLVDGKIAEADLPCCKKIVVLQETGVGPRAVNPDQLAQVEELSPTTVLIRMNGTPNFTADGTVVSITALLNAP